MFVLENSRASIGHRFFLQLISTRDSAFTGRVYHDIYYLICSMKQFWDMLLSKPAELLPNQEAWCRSKNIGRAHECDANSLVPDESYTMCPTFESHNIGFAFVMAKAAATSSEVLRSSQYEAHTRDPALEIACSCIFNLDNTLAWVHGIAYFIKSAFNTINQKAD